MGGVQGGKDDPDAAAPVGSVLNSGKGQKQEETKFQAFTGKGVSLGSQAQQDVVMRDEDAALYSQYGDDPELAYAIKMSMLEEEAKRAQVPDEPPLGEPNSVTL